MAENKWICENEKTIIDHPVVKIIQRNCRSSDEDKTHKFYIIRSPNWCNIIPVTEDGKVVMVKQYRLGIDEFTLEIPGGLADAEDKDIQTTAIREMIEETGYEPLPEAKCIPLGWSFPNPAIQDNRCHAFVVGPVRRTRAQKLDATEMIEVVEVPIEEIPEKLAQGQITHALMMNSFFYLLLGTDGGRDILRRELGRFTGHA
jgi:8-oxo-dGTP pyrophosphatase MutT (NUDIX family)